MEYRELPHVLVMMATYNGEHYIADQVDSVLNQKDVRITLWISDDCSTDSTMELLKRYEDDPRVQVHRNETNRGVALNFMQMVYRANEATFDYYAFADQDDVWLPEKLSVAIQYIEKHLCDSTVRRIKGIGTPVLYCSDLQNVNSGLSDARRELAGLRINPELRATPLLRNWYSGCTMVFNPAMLRLICKKQYGEFPRIHDTWVYLLAYYCGNVFFDSDSAHILRRITGNNTEGAVFPGRDARASSVRRMFQKSKHGCIKMAQMLLSDYKSYIERADLKVIESFVSYNSSISSKMDWVFRTDYTSLNLTDTLMMKIKLLLGRY